MMREPLRSTLIVSAGAALAALGLAPARAAAPEDQMPDARPEQKQPAVDPATIWSAGLSHLAGTYRFVQVCSPGGLWLSALSKKANARPINRQVSINELPPALRETLTHAEVQITDLKLPGSVQASEETSPSGRGKLRFYDEEASGRLVVRNLPGASGEDGDKGQYSGPALFHLSHRSHSNPSPSGVFFIRQRQEATWGAATLDYADLTADALAPAAPAEGSKTGAAAPAARPAVQDKGSKPSGGKAGEAEDHLILGNVRVLRSGRELVAFVEWRISDPDGSRTYRGTVRLMRTDDLPDPPKGDPGEVGVSLKPSGPAPARPSAVRRRE